MRDIIVDATNFSYKKRNYLKTCLTIPTGNRIDDRNNAELIEYINALENHIIDNTEV